MLFIVNDVVNFWFGDLMHYKGSGVFGCYVVMFIGWDVVGVFWFIEVKGAAYGVVLLSNHLLFSAVMIIRVVL